MKVLERVLSGREGRARLQKYILESAPLIVQVSLNLPGYPKETAGSLNLVEAIGVFMVKKCTSMGGRTPSLWVLENGMAQKSKGACHVPGGPQLMGSSP
jgi:hypothetical protein